MRGTKKSMRESLSVSSRTFKRSLSDSKADQHFKKQRTLSQYSDLSYQSTGKDSVDIKGTDTDLLHRVTETETLELINLHHIGNMIDQGSTHRRQSSKNMNGNTEIDNAGQHPASIKGISWQLMRNEFHRLLTFTAYPVGTNKFAILLARNGFVYIGTGADNDDSVRCAFCFAVKQRWKVEDDIPTVHRQLSPSCPIVTGSSCDNVLLAQSTSSFEDFTNQSRTSAGASDGDTNSDFDETDNARNHSAHDLGGLECDGASVQSDVIFYNGQGLNSVPLVNNVPTTAEIEATSEEPAHNFSEPEPQTSAQGLSEENPTNVNDASHESHTDSQPTVPSQSQSETTSSSAANSVSSENIPTTSPDSSVPDQMSTGSAAPPPPPQTPANQSAGSANSTTWADLGIHVELPKRPQFGLKEVRRQSFQSWPADHPVPVEDLVESGFYYAEYSDCARCFFCGGGLRNWEPTDNAFVEHARWFPKCSYIRQTVGIDFLNTVQDMHNGGTQDITLNDVANKLGKSVDELLNKKCGDASLKNDPGVKAVIDIGFDSKDVLEAARALRHDSDNSLSSEALLTVLHASGKKARHKEDIETDSAEQPSKETIEDIKSMNNQLRQQTACKICLTNSVSVLFLPCGHLACCVDCALCLRDCPICRKSIKGTVRVSLH